MISQSDHSLTRCIPHVEFNSEARCYLLLDALLITISEQYKRISMSLGMLQAHLSLHVDTWLRRAPDLDRMQVLSHMIVHQIAALTSPQFAAKTHKDTASDSHDAGTLAHEDSLCICIEPLF